MPAASRVRRHPRFDLGPGGTAVFVRRPGSVPAALYHTAASPRPRFPHPLCLSVRPERSPLAASTLAAPSPPAERSQGAPQGSGIAGRVPQSPCALAVPAERQRGRQSPRLALPSAAGLQAAASRRAGQQALPAERESSGSQARASARPLAAERSARSRYRVHPGSGGRGSALPAGPEANSASPPLPRHRRPGQAGG